MSRDLPEGFLITIYYIYSLFNLFLWKGRWYNFNVMQSHDTLWFINIYPIIHLESWFQFIALLFHRKIKGDLFFGETNCLRKRKEEAFCNFVDDGGFRYLDTFDLVRL